MSNMTDVIEYLIKQDRKDLAEVVVRELKDNTVIHQQPVPLPPRSIERPSASSFPSQWMLVV